MLKNKFLLLAVFCFVGVSFASENDQEESPTFFQKAKGSLKSAYQSPVTPFLITFFAKPMIQSSTKFVCSKLPGVLFLSAFVNTWIRKEDSQLNCINTFVPCFSTLNKIFSTYGAYYVSGKLVSDSDINKTARLMGVVASFSNSNEVSSSVGGSRFQKNTFI